MSSLVYDDNTHVLKAFNSQGTEVGSWTAYNNTVSASGGGFPPGEFTFSWHSPHSGGTAKGPYGSNGNFIFNVGTREGMGIHAGRSGPKSKTNGCIRTSDDATAAIKALHQNDPIEKLTVTR